MRTLPFPRPSQRRRGFTILEILIATAILTLGLVGILAIFPIAIDSGRKVMERSTAVTIAKSVTEAIRSCMRNQKRTVYQGEESFTYFVFQHDGVRDPIPRSREQEKFDADYFILLPQFKPGAKFDGGTDSANREKAVAASAEFVYPESDDPPNGNGNPYRARDNGRDGANGQGIIVKKVYQLGNLFPDAENTKRLPEDRILADQITESFKQYSFAFSIRASKFDTSLSPPSARGTFIPGNTLYHVRVMIFRAFTYNEERARQEGKGPEPIYEQDFEVSK